MECIRICAVSESADGIKISSEYFGHREERFLLYAQIFLLQFIRGGCFGHREGKRVLYAQESINEF